MYKTTKWPTSSQVLIDPVAWTLYSVVRNGTTMAEQRCPEDASTGTRIKIGTWKGEKSQP